MTSSLADYSIFFIPFIGAVFLGIVWGLSFLSLNGIESLFPEQAEKKKTRFTACLKLVKGWTGWFYTSVAVVSSFAMGYLINFHSETYKKYSPPYNWYDPMDYIRFPVDQLLTQKQKDIPPISINLNAFNSRGNYYHLILVDWTASSLNDPQQAADLNKLLRSYFKKATNCEIYDDDYSFREGLPILLMGNLFLKHRAENQYLSCVAYMGIDSSLKELMDQGWTKCSDGINFCDNMSATKQSLAVNIYHDFVLAYKKLDAFHRAEEITDFSLMANKLKEKLTGRRELGTTYSESNYVAVTIISDFIHEFNKRKKVSIADVKESFKSLLSLPCVRQINLVRIPAPGENDLVSNRIISTIDSAAAATSNRPRYVEVIDASGESFSRNAFCMEELLAATSNFEALRPEKGLDLYSPIWRDGEIASNMGKLTIDSIDDDGEFLQFKLRGDRGLSSETKCLLSRHSGARPQIAIDKDRWTTMQVKPKDELECGVSLSRGDDGQKLYLDVYSSRTNVKQEIPLTIKPFLPGGVCFLLILLYFVGVANLCEILLCYFYLFCKYGKMGIVTGKGIEIFFFSILGSIAYGLIIPVTLAFNILLVYQLVTVGWAIHGSDPLLVGFLIAIYVVFACAAFWRYHRLRKGEKKVDLERGPGKHGWGRPIET